MISWAICSHVKFPSLCCSCGWNLLFVLKHEGGTQVDFSGFVSGTLHIDSDRLLKSLREKNQEKLSQLLQKAADDARPCLDSFSGCYQGSCCIQGSPKASGAD